MMMTETARRMSAACDAVVPQVALQLVVLTNVLDMLAGAMALAFCTGAPACEASEIRREQSSMERPRASAESTPLDPLPKTPSQRANTCKRMEDVPGILQVRARRESVERRLASAEGASSQKPW
jgi:hypothetical protein